MSFQTARMTPEQRRRRRTRHTGRPVKLTFSFAASGSARYASAGWQPKNPTPYDNPVTHYPHRPWWKRLLRKF